MKKKILRAMSLLMTAALVSTTVNINVFADNDFNVGDVSDSNISVESEDLPNVNDTVTLKNPVWDSNNISTWDCIWFGNYWQNDTNGDGVADDKDAKEPIKWRVLKVDGNDAFLMSDKLLSAMNYNYDKHQIDNESEEMNEYWYQGAVRSWLNGYGPNENYFKSDYTNDNFFDEAFSEKEKQSIKLSKVINGKSSQGIDCGRDTEDYVYIPSYDEINTREYGFRDTRKTYDTYEEAEADMYFMSAQGTQYALKKASLYANDYDENDILHDNMNWFLRSVHEVNKITSYEKEVIIYEADTVLIEGGIISMWVVYPIECAIRPMMHIDLSSNEWSYAGTVTLDRKVQEKPASNALKNGVITFDANGGQTEDTSRSVNVGGTYGKLPHAIREGYIFDGWYTDKQSGSLVTDFSDMNISSNQTLYAHWSVDNGPVRNPYVFNNVSIWDTIYFGNYYQSNSQEKEPIKWRVLNLEGTEAILLADKNLDCKKYNETKANVKWDNSTIRSWLNGYGKDKNACGIDYSKDNFIDEAFTDEEKQIISESLVSNPLNEKYNISNGSDTKDKVYLLSGNEIYNEKYGFIDYHYCKDKNDEGAADATRVAKDTSYAIEKGVEVISEEYIYDFGWESKYLDNGSWWLRSAGFNDEYFMHITSRGWESNSEMIIADIGVRPVIRIDLSKTGLWKKADVVSSEEFNKDIDFSISIAVKQKYDISSYFYMAYDVSKYVVSGDGKAKVNKDGILTAKKAGTITVTPYTGKGKNAQPIPDVKPITITITNPSFSQKLSGYYISQTVSANQFLTNIPERGNTVTWSVPNSKVCNIDEYTGEITILNSGKVKVTATITNNKGGFVKVSTMLIVKIPKLSVKDTFNLKNGKTKKITLKNVPKGEDVKWIVENKDIVDISSVSNKCTVRAKATGSTKITAIYGTQEYSTVVNVQ